jgi:leader peptidase (prepilin peptidase) / N-methyltransferase
VISTAIDQSFMRWFWTGAGIWLIALSIVLPGQPVSAWFALIGALPFLGALLAFDMRQRRLPLALSYSGLTIVLATAGVGSLVEHDWKVVDVLIGCAAFGLIGRLIGSQPRLFGRGDVHMCPLMGALVGWFDPSATFLAVFVAALAGAVIAAALLMFRRTGPTALMAYGPFLMFGTIVAILVSNA